MKNLKIYALLSGGLVLSGTIGFLAGQVKSYRDLYEAKSMETTSTESETEDSSIEDSLEMLIEKAVQKKTESMALENSSLSTKVSYLETEEETVEEEETEIMEETVYETMTESETKISSFEPSLEEMEETFSQSFANFEEEAQEVDQLVSSDDSKTITEKGEQYIQSGIDFVLHGKEIGGVTFDELTERGKQETIENLYRMYGLVTGTDPYYKEQFGEDFKTIMNQGKEKKEDSSTTSQYNFSDALREEAENIRYVLKKIQSETGK